jgi:SAM-dependent methyltransferase
VSTDHAARQGSQQRGAAGRADLLTAQPTAVFAAELFAQRIMQYAAAHPGTLQILEAGCGRRWGLQLPGVDFWLSGIDVNPQCMQARRQVGDLDEAIVADLRAVELQPGRYDVAYCAFVLEHIAGAEQVLDRLAGAVKPGGMLLLRLPSRDSVYGFAARCSPHWLHVRYKRWIVGNRRAGTPGHGPFPTVYDQVVSWPGMQQYCTSRGLLITDAYTSNFYLRKLGLFARPVDLAVRAIAALSLGHLTGDYNNLALVIRKPG